MSGSGLKFGSISQVQSCQYRSGPGFSFCPAESSNLNPISMSMSAPLEVTLHLLTVVPLCTVTMDVQAIWLLLILKKMSKLNDSEARSKVIQTTFFV